MTADWVRGLDVDRHKSRGVLHGAGWPLSKEPEVLDDGHKSGRVAEAATPCTSEVF